MRHPPLVVILACWSHRSDASISSSVVNAKAQPPPPPRQQDLQSTSSLLSSSASSSIREEAFYSDLPPTVFNPSGRLVSLESAVQRLSDPLNPSGSLVVAIHCHQGMAIVASLPRSPNLYDPPPPHHNDASAASNITSVNDTTIAGNSSTTTNTSTAAGGDGRNKDDIQEPLLVLFKSPLRNAGAAAYDNKNNNKSLVPTINPPPLPFCVMGSTLLGAVGGAASDGLVLKTRLQRMAHELRADGEDIDGGGKGQQQQQPFVARNVARRLADSFHARTLREADRDGNAHRILACGAVLCDPRELWRVDPSGQFYRCRAAVAGRASALAESVLVEMLKARCARRKKTLGGDGSSEEAAANVDPGVDRYHGRQVRQDLVDLTLEEALAVATQTIRTTLQRPIPSSIRQGGEAGSDGVIRILGMTLSKDSVATTEWHDEDRLADMVRKLEELKA
jgi:20S proteasome alpha/beta subunit